MNATSAPVPGVAGRRSRAGVNSVVRCSCPRLLTRSSAAATSGCPPSACSATSTACPRARSTGLRHHRAEHRRHQRPQRRTGVRLGRDRRDHTLGVPPLPQLQGGFDERVPVAEVPVEAALRGPQPRRDRLHRRRPRARRRPPRRARPRPTRVGPAASVRACPYATVRTTYAGVWRSADGPQRPRPRVRRPGIRWGALLDTLGGPADALWPGPQWGATQLDRPLRVGSGGGHGPIRYHVTGDEPAGGSSARSIPVRAARHARVHRRAGRATGAGCGTRSTAGPRA